jgi:hypothetical protein
MRNRRLFCHTPVALLGAVGVRLCRVVLLVL